MNPVTLPLYSVSTLTCLMTSCHPYYSISTSVFCCIILEMLSFWATFAAYFSSQENPSLVASAQTPSKKNFDEAESLILELLEIYGKLKSMKSLHPCDEVDNLFERLVNICILNRSSQITNQVGESSFL